MGAEDINQALAARLEALSPRRLTILTGLFIVAMAVLLFTKLQEESNARRTETNLRVTNAASECAATMNIALVSGEAFAQSLAKCHPGGASASFHLTPSGEIQTAHGRTDEIKLDAAAVANLPVQRSGDITVALPSGKTRAAWRTLDNGDRLIVTAPAHDFYERSPAWLAFALILSAITLVIASLLGAFMRQSRNAGAAAGAIHALDQILGALDAGRCSPWRFNAQSQTVVLSRSFLEPMGLGKRDRSFSLQEISALSHPKDLRTALAIFTGKSGDINEGTIRLRLSNGAWAPVYLRTNATHAKKNVRAGIAIDMRGAKDEVAGAGVAETRLKDAIESIPEAFVLWDAKQNLAAWNQRFAAIFRFAPGAIHTGMNISELTAAAKEYADTLAQHFGPEAPHKEESLEVGLKGDHWLHIARSRTAEGGIVCIASNVTDTKRRARAQKRKERILRSAVDDLEASRRELSTTMHNYELEKHRAEDASRSKSEFLANMSHELRTPLNAINGFSEIMMSELYGPLGDTKYKEYVADILSSGRHLLELIDDILDMSKIEAGRVNLSPNKVELERVLEECGRLVTKRANDAGINLRVSVGNVPSVWADPRAAKQVVLNLLSNAIKFTDAKGEITLTAEADLDCVTVIVVDSGCGIEANHIDRLGAPFELIEAHTSKTRSGSGLGLALSKALMDLQGGILAIASQHGKGTVACATFPRRVNAKVRLPLFVRDEAHILTGVKSKRTPAPGKIQKTAQEAAE